MDFQPLHVDVPLFSHYAPDRLTLGGMNYTDPVIVIPDAVPQMLSENTIRTVYEWLAHMSTPLCEAHAEVVLVGTGRKLQFPSSNDRQKLYEKGLINIEWMDTAAACRTFNLLSGEGRRVAGLFWIDGTNIL